MYDLVVNTKIGFLSSRLKYCERPEDCTCEMYPPMPHYKEARHPTELSSLIKKLFPAFRFKEEVRYALKYGMNQNLLLLENSSTQIYLRALISLISFPLNGFAAAYYHK